MHVVEKGRKNVGVFFLLLVDVLMDFSRELAVVLCSDFGGRCRLCSGSCSCRFDQDAFHLCLRVESLKLKS